MKKIFLFAAALVASVSLSAEVSVEVCALDSAKLASLAGAPVPTKTYTEAAITAGTVFLDGANMKVSLPFDQTLQWISAAQPNGAHKTVVIGSTEINMNEAIQGKDNPKDADGGNPCNTLIAPVQGGCFKVDAKANGWIVVLHKASSNKQYFVFENGTCLGYKFGMMTYAENPLGENGLLQYILRGDDEFNYLTLETIESLTGFPKIEFVENYVNLDTIASGISPGTYKQNGVSAMAFQAFQGCEYLLGAAGSKMTCAAIAFVKDLDGTLPVVAMGETIEEEGKDPVVYSAVELLELVAAGEGIEHTNAAVKATKTFENGQLVIIKNGVRYNALGVQL
jgi:hypothetical protein